MDGDRVNNSIAELKMSNFRKANDKFVNRPAVSGLGRFLCAGCGFGQNGLFVESFRIVNEFLYIFYIVYVIPYTNRI